MAVFLTAACSFTLMEVVVHTFTDKHAEAAVTQVQLIIADMVASGNLQEAYAICVLTDAAVTIDFSQHVGQEMQIFYERAMLFFVAEGNSPNLAELGDTAVYNAELTLCHRKNARDVPLADRGPGDTVTYGSVIVDNIIVSVACSNHDFGEMIAYMIAHVIRGYAQVRATP